LQIRLYEKKLEKMEKATTNEMEVAKKKIKERKIKKKSSKS